MPEPPQSQDTVVALKSALNAVDRIRNVQALELLALERLAAHHGILGLTETMGPLRERGAWAH